MNDDELRAQLERRANLADLGPGFSAAARDAMDTRPEPVGASRVPPLVGMAGLAAALMLLVIALPRLGPGPVASTPLDGPVSATERLGDFALSITSSRSEYVAFEPIQAEAAFTYDGPADQIEVTGAASLLGFGIERADGFLRNGPAWRDVCRIHSLTRGIPVQQAFVKSGGFAEVDQDAAFWSSYFDDPALRLPAGDWRIFAVASFGTGGCGSESELTAAISIRVLPSRSVTPVPAPTPSPAPSATPQDGPPQLVNTAWWELAPDERPTGSSTELRLVVHEYACASGLSPEGRIQGTVEHGATEVTITFEVRPLPGGQDCPSAPGTPVTITLTDPLGNRGLVDGNAGAVVIERDAEFIAFGSSGVDQTAHERLEALAGPDACISVIQYDRNVPTQAELEAWATDLGPGSGFVPVGYNIPQAFLGDWLEAARAFGATEAFAGRPKPWYMIARVIDTPSGAIVDPRALVLASLDPFPISGGRTIWFRGFYQATYATPGPNCATSTDSWVVNGHELDFALSSSKTLYEAFEPIEINALLTYRGPDRSVNLFGGGRVLAFRFEQLDGDLKSPPSQSILIGRCLDLGQLRAGEPREYSYSMPTEWSSSLPWADFYETYTRDGRLTLPPGTYRFYAGTSFSVGSTCTSPETDLSVEIIVRVVPLTSPRPSPDYAPDELIVQFCRPPTQQEVGAFEAANGLVLKHHSALPGVDMWLFRILDGVDPNDKAAAVVEDPSVCRATPNWFGISF